MKILTVVDYLTKTFTPEVEKTLAKNIQDRIDANDQYSGWYKTLTPLQLHCHSFVGSVKVVDNKIVQRSDMYYKAVCFMPTDKEFYPSYTCDGYAYCYATMTKVESNLDLYTIHLSGDDDYSVSFDIIGEDAAYNEWDRLMSVDYITDELIEQYYFSN